MWTCPNCGRRFKLRNQSHTCETFDLERHLVGKPAHTVALFHHAVARAREVGNVEVVPMKSSILLRSKTAFGSLTVRRRWVDVYFSLAHEAPSSRIRRIVRASAARFIHCVRLEALDDVDDELVRWLAQAYALSSV